MAAFERLVRFETTDGSVKYGNLEKETPTREIEGSEVEVVEGDVQSGFRKGSGRVRIGKVCLILFHCLENDPGSGMFWWCWRNFKPSVEFAGGTDDNGWLAFSMGYHRNHDGHMCMEFDSIC